ncbi:hypothetical protein ACIZ62_12740 [Acetobacterium carbinolicum]|uniref:hypothetical protein n=1 Tax=Acetobacterium carbinolicum TaxID=52690 RepID=UPI0039BFAA4B
MPLLDEMNHEFEENFEEIECNMDYKIKKLGLTQERIEDLRNMTCKSIKINYIEIGKIEEYIELSRLVGSCRPNLGNTWYDNLEDLHKTTNFERYLNKENFEKYLKNMSEEDLPDVIEFQDEYYINGNGRHRLTIAKCVGVERIKAVVGSMKSQLDKE